MATFLARLHTKSFIYRQWRERHRVSGIIDTILFRLINGREYYSGVLTDEQIEKVRARQDQAIILEVAAIPKQVIDEALAKPPTEADVVDFTKELEKQPVVEPPKKRQRTKLD